MKSHAGRETLALLTGSPVVRGLLKKEDLAKGREKDTAAVYGGGRDGGVCEGCGGGNSNKGRT